MVKEENVKIITLSFVLAGFLTALVVKILLESIAGYSGLVAGLYGQEWFRHGLTVSSGLAVFAYLQLRERSRLWAHEVIVEIRKVVWPSRQETLGMTVMVCIILMISGFVLGLFDLAGGAVINFIIN